MPVQVTVDDIAEATTAFTYLSQLVFSCQTRETILQLYCHLSTMSEAVSAAALNNSDGAENGQAIENDRLNKSGDGAGKPAVAGWLKLSQAESSNNPAILQEAIGREALTYQPPPATREVIMRNSMKPLLYVQNV